MPPTAPDQGAASNANALSKSSRFLLGLMAGALPAAIFLIAANNLIPGAFLLPILGVANGAFWLSLLASVWVASRGRKRLISVGFLVGVAASSLVLVLLLATTGAIF
jgi:hypothetical protein